MKQILAILTLLPFVASAQNTTSVSGVITYYFNEYQGDKPDIGAKVYLIDSPTNPGFNASSVDSFCMAKTYRAFMVRNLEMEGKYLELARPFEKRKKYKSFYDEYMKTAAERRASADDYANRLKEMGLYSDESFAALDARVSIMIIMINKQETPSKTVDATGSYSFATAPGTYSVLVVSNNRKGSTSTELLGKVYAKKIEVKDGQAKDISYRFDLY